MEAFSLLKYWRGGATTCILPSSTPPPPPSTRSTTTIVTAVSEEEDDDGPFFDLEFSLPQEGESVTKEEEGSVNESDEVLAVESIISECDEELLQGEEEEESELRFTLSSSPDDSSTDSNDQTALPLSPSDDLFFKGKLVPIIDDDPAESLNSNSSSARPPAHNQLSISFLKSATKLKVFNLGLKRSSKLLLTDGNGGGSVPVAGSTPKHESEECKKESSKFFMVKFKVEDVVNIASLFNSSTSSRSSSSKQKPVTTTTNSSTTTTGTTDDISGCNNEEKMFSKEAVQKYLKKVKPLYIRVSKRYGDKLKFPSGALVSLSHGVNNKPAERKTTATKGGGVEGIEKDGLSNLQAGIRVACKRLGKSRSASSVAVSAVVPAVPCHVQSSRRDDSLLQQEDGIQGAILHCKRSFNASRDSDSSILPRSSSDPSHDKAAKISSEA